MSKIFKHCCSKDSVLQVHLFTVQMYSLIITIYIVFYHKHAHMVQGSAVKQKFFEVDEARIGTWWHLICKLIPLSNPTNICMIFHDVSSTVNHNTHLCVACVHLYCYLNTCICITYSPTYMYMYACIYIFMYMLSEYTTLYIHIIITMKISLFDFQCTCILHVHCTIYMYPTYT